jgi:uncharacterized OsmC-like protein
MLILVLVVYFRTGHRIVEKQKQSNHSYNPYKGTDMGQITEINGVNVTKKLEFKALIKKDPSNADNNNTLVAHWVGGSRSRVELKDKVVHLGGPGEFDAMQMLLAALAACDVDLMAIHASLLGLKIESLSVEATGHFNAQSYMGLEDAPDSAYDAISYIVHVSVPGATQDQIAYLRERCERSSPVRDSLMRSIPLKFEFNANS